MKFSLVILLLLRISELEGKINFTLYDDVNHNCHWLWGGHCETFNLKESECISFHFWEDKIQSIDTYGHCIKIWEGERCSGEWERVAPSTEFHNDLHLLDRGSSEEEEWANNVASISSCQYENVCQAIVRNLTEPVEQRFKRDLDGLMETEGILKEILGNEENFRDNSQNNVDNSQSFGDNLDTSRDNSDKHQKTRDNSDTSQSANYLHKSQDIKKRDGETPDNLNGHKDTPSIMNRDIRDSSNSNDTWNNRLGNWTLYPVSLSRKKRDSHSLFSHEPINNLFFGMPTIYIPQADNPIYKVYFTRDTKKFRLIRAVQAEIRGYHVSPSRRITFPEPLATRQMNDMEACGYSRKDCQKDSKGSLVPGSLSGPGSWYNMVPKSSRSFTRGGTSDAWEKMERAVLQYVVKGCGHVRWNVAVNYKPPGRRPKGFRFYLTFHTNQGLRDGTYDAYFINDAVKLRRN